MFIQKYLNHNSTSNITERTRAVEIACVCTRAEAKKNENPEGRGGGELWRPPFGSRLAIADSQPVPSYHLASQHTDTTDHFEKIVK